MLDSWFVRQIGKIIYNLKIQYIYWNTTRCLLGVFMPTYEHSQLRGFGIQNFFKRTLNTYNHGCVQIWQL